MTLRLDILHNKDCIAGLKNSKTGWSTSRLPIRRSISVTSTIRTKTSSIARNTWRGAGIGRPSRSGAQARRNLLAGHRRRVRGRAEGDAAARTRADLPELGRVVLHVRVNCKYKFSRSHAHLFHMVKNPKAFTFNVEAVRVPSARQLVYGDKRANPTGRLPDDTGSSAPRTCPTGSSPTRTPGTSRASAARSKSGRLARLPDARATVGPRHPCFEQRGRVGARSVRRQRDDLGGGQKARPPLPRLRAVGGVLPADRKRLERIKPGDPLDGAPEPLASCPTTANGRRLDSRESKKTGPGPKSKQKKKPTAKDQKSLPGF